MQWDEGHCHCNNGGSDCYHSASVKKRHYLGSLSKCWMSALREVKEAKRVRHAGGGPGKKRQTKQSVFWGGFCRRFFRRLQEERKLGDAYHVPQLQLIWGLVDKLSLQKPDWRSPAGACVREGRDVTLERNCYNVNIGAACSASITTDLSWGQGNGFYLKNKAIFRTIKNSQHDCIYAL